MLDTDLFAILLDDQRKAQTYIDKVLATQPDDLIGYWVMGESSGTLAADSSPQGNDGTFTGVTLGQEGIGDGSTCPLFDGANDVVDIYSAGLAADFNVAEGALMAWLKVSAAGVWTDGAIRALINLEVDGNNRVRLYKNSTNNQLVAHYEANNVSEFVIHTISDTDWVHFLMTWSVAADQVKGYVAGSQVDTTKTALGTWVGALNSDRTAIGSGRVATPAEVFDGTEAHVALWKAPLAQALITPLASV